MKLPLVKNTLLNTFLKHIITIITMQLNYIYSTDKVQEELNWLNKRKDHYVKK
jgi:hypothetical protein